MTDVTDVTPSDPVPTVPTLATVPTGRPDRSDGERLLREMLRIRRFEERCVELYSASRIRGFMHLCIGEEAVAVGAMAALTPEDTVVSTYREHGHALARGLTARSVLAEMYGRREGCSGGRGGSMHLFDAGLRFIGGNAIVAGGLPLAVGFALADRMRQDARVTACLFGDGAVAEGEFHESLNLAALWSLPVVFLCENNYYAMGTALGRAQAQTDLALRAAAYGLVAWAVDGMDVLACRSACERAVAMARSGAGPVFLELRTYRFRAHSMYDPELYRSKTEVQRWKERDPVEALARLLAADGLTTDDRGRMEQEVAAEIDDAVAFAEAGTLEPVADLGRHVLRRSAS